MSRRTRLALGSVALVALSALTTACGSDSSVDGKQDGDRVTTQADDGGNGGNGGNGGTGGSQALTAANFGTSIATAQRDVGTVHMVVTTSSAQTGDIQMSADTKLGSSLADFQMDMHMTVAGQQAEMRLVDSAIYMRGSMLPTSSKPWVKIDLSDPDNPLGALYEQMLSVSDPDHLAKFYASVTSFKALGSESVAGLQTQHYRISVDTAAALKAMGFAKIPGVSIKQILAQLPKTTTSDAWVDAQNRPVQMKYDLAGTASTIRFSQWGDPVDVHAPKPSTAGPLKF